MMIFTTDLETFIRKGAVLTLFFIGYKTHEVDICFSLSFGFRCSKR